MQRGGARTRRRRRARPRTRARAGLELRDLRPHRQLPALEHLRDRRELLRADVRASARRIAGVAFSRYHAIVRVEALVELDLRLEAEQLARLLDVRDPQLDVGVVERLEDDLAGGAA